MVGSSSLVPPRLIVRMGFAKDLPLTAIFILCYSSS